jgi:hypothetical protein
MGFSLDCSEVRQNGMGLGILKELREQKSGMKNL